MHKKHRIIRGYWKLNNSLLNYEDLKSEFSIIIGSLQLIMVNLVNNGNMVVRTYGI